MNVNFGATLDPYAIDNSGSRINIYNINNGGSLFRMTSANLTMNYSISSRENGKTKTQTKQSQRNGGRDDLFGANTILNDNRRSQFDGAEEGGEDKISEFFTQNYHGI
jgi:hypothetical protein